MASNRLVMYMSTIPSSVQDINARFNGGVFNNDRTKRQIDGYIVDGSGDAVLPKKLCHDANYLEYLCRGEIDPAATVQLILNESYEIKTSDYLVMRDDPNSEWYINNEGDG